MTDSDRRRLPLGRSGVLWAPESDKRHRSREPSHLSVDIAFFVGKARESGMLLDKTEGAVEGNSTQ